MGSSLNNDGKKSPYCFAAIVIGLIVLILLAVTLFKALPCSFASLAGNDSYKISSVERMCADEAPVTHRVNTDSDSYENLMRALNSEQLTFVRDEVGMSLDDTLYTLFLSGAESDMANFSFSSDGLVHDNEAEKTYRLSDRTIYGLCEQLYESSES